MSKHRIELLDSFRFLAILSVLLYHYTIKWAPLLPYGHFFGDRFDFGFLGVHFFFIISGFVIHYTLENTPDPFSFFRNRFARLFPAMLLCSAVTFFVMRLIDDGRLFPDTHEAWNFLPSLTFVNPVLWNSLTGGRFAWLNGSYWSLWTEIQFYFIAGAVYFPGKRHYFRNVLLAGLFVCSVKYVPVLAEILLHRCSPSAARISLFAKWKYYCAAFNISYFMLWFLAGTVFYELYKRVHNQRPASLWFRMMVVAVFLCLLGETLIFYSGILRQTLPTVFVMILLFLCLIYRPGMLRFLKHPLPARIGLISYSIYLIHEDIGVILIRRTASWLGPWSPIAVIIVIALIVGFAELSYRYYEKKAGAILKNAYKNSRLS
jgi:peptidoglycan/LPS O-acetylase OafA/YrhL